EVSLREVSFVLKIISPEKRSQRYVILSFIANFIADIIKKRPKSEFIDRMEELKEFVYKNAKYIRKFEEYAEGKEFLAELKNWSRIYKELRMFKENINV